ncbi:transmembrane protein 218 [Brienomyrus brachyistius]|uniref:transmembrane protein 218 n=1 Tax=Brienomyrus brachyistius TaxID=42636 RepID=UPI0020B44817|nr:transmembrane protein 218 [Brienomyrus brachyistius]
MPGTVLGVGPGVFLLGLIWIATLLLAVLLSRASRSAKFSIIPLILLAIVVTLVLLFFPRSSEIPTPVREVETVDGFFVGRYVLLSVAGAAFLAALFLLLPLHFLTPVYAKPLQLH